MSDEGLAKLKVLNNPQRLMKKTEQSCKNLEDPVSLGGSSTILDVEYEELKQKDESGEGSTPKQLTKQISHMQI